VHFSGAIRTGDRITDRVREAERGESVIG